MIVVPFSSAGFSTVRRGVADDVPLDDGPGDRVMGSDAVAEAGKGVLAGAVGDSAVIAGPTVVVLHPDSTKQTASKRVFIPSSVPQRKRVRSVEPGCYAPERLIDQAKDVDRSRRTRSRRREGRCRRRWGVGSRCLAPVRYGSSLGDRHLA